jgi:hypothetical protein
MGYLENHAAGPASCLGKSSRLVKHTYIHTLDHLHLPYHDTFQTRSSLLDQGLFPAQTRQQPTPEFLVQRWVMGPLSDGVSERMCVNHCTISLNGPVAQRDASTTLVCDTLCRANPVRSADGGGGSHRGEAIPLCRQAGIDPSW